MEIIALETISIAINHIKDMECHQKHFSVGNIYKNKSLLKKAVKNHNIIVSPKTLTVNLEQEYGD